MPYIQRNDEWIGDSLVDVATLPLATTNQFKFRYDTNTKKRFYSNGTSWVEISDGVGTNEERGTINIKAYDVIGEGFFRNIQYHGTIAAFDNDSSGYWARILSNAVSGAFAGVAQYQSILESIRRSFPGWFYMKYQTNGADYPMAAGQRFVFGFQDAASLLPDSNTLLADARHGFLIVFRAGLDTNYMILHNDGTGPMQVIDTLVPFPTISTIHDVEIQYSPTDFRWIIRNSGGTILGQNSVTTRIPATTTRVYFFAGMQGNAKNILIRNIKCKVGGK